MYVLIIRKLIFSSWLFLFLISETFTATRKYFIARSDDRHSKSYQYVIPGSLQEPIYAQQWHHNNKHFRLSFVFQLRKTYSYTLRAPHFSCWAAPSEGSGWWSSWDIYMYNHLHTTISLNINTFFIGYWCIKGAYISVQRGTVLHNRYVPGILYRGWRTC